ncbi:putative membrane protein [Streptomyces davaonensis JCM 4913]|uniref:Putative membrane protein n=1 Tax=Streptomyces davaonensis (strain DSM 101723 / JCM 4913 / KCC S-0913 / 768) TaxID=1214101 RepID=K4RFV9_STRDJ|nr:DUF4436 domain-containing protein [Streptomyces davaonensis]CCK32004.1 putative membrane protein [Streptomyces davaonensis JCM 4913]
MTWKNESSLGDVLAASVSVAAVLVAMYQLLRPRRDLITERRADLLLDQLAEGRFFRTMCVTISVLLIAFICAAAGVMLYAHERDSRRQVLVGDASSPNRLDVEVTVQKVDAANHQLTMRVLAVPHGSVGGNEIPAHDLVLYTTSLFKTDLTYTAGRIISAQDITASLVGGTISDYPYDRYSTTIAFAATSQATPLPVSVSLTNEDPSFHLTALNSAGDQHFVVGLEGHVARSRGTLILAGIMVVAMWVLGLAVASAAGIIISRCLGLVWSAMGWMAATLFALVGLRNAAPGSPPIGSQFDYASFFWVELVIILSIAVVAVHGIRTPDAHQ